MAALLILHIVAGVAALAGGLVALAAPKGKALHRQAGTVFFWGMAAVFASAVILAVAENNLFLLLIALFSFYLAFAGWRFARNRSGVAAAIDWLAVAAMAIAGLGMAALAWRYVDQGDAQWVTLAAFASIALALALADGLAHRAGASRGPARIARHLTNMTAGVIATLTAVLVVNFEMKPAWVLWLAPTAALTPLITWWNVKLALAARKAKSA